MAFENGFPTIVDSDIVKNDQAKISRRVKKKSSFFSKKILTFNDDSYLNCQ